MMALPAVVLEVNVTVDEVRHDLLNVLSLYDC
jgi:hypothetical protein